MRTALFTLLLLLPGLAFAKGPPKPSDIAGDYESEAEMGKPEVTLELMKGGKFSARVVDHEVTPNTETLYTGTWNLKGIKVSLASKKARCRLNYKTEVEFYAGTSVGPGLLCPLNKKYSAEFCPCSFRKK